MVTRRKSRHGSDGAQHGNGNVAPNFQWVYDPSGDVDPTLYALEERSTGYDVYTFARPPDEAHDVAAASLESPWAATPPPALPAPAQPPGSSARPDPRTAYVRHSLDSALDRWRSSGETASPALTHAGLDALSTGAGLAPDQRSLLLRSALRQRQGMRTALQYQDDMERVALILAEELTAPKRRVTPELILRLQEEDPRSDQWSAPLLRELRYMVASTDVRVRRHAVDALWRLEGETPPSPAAAATRGSAIRPLALAAAILLLTAGSLLTARVVIGKSTGQATVPPGVYTLAGADGQPVQVDADGFSVDRYEVTNDQYRRCVATGACSPPGHYGDESHDSFPVANVTLAQAEQYCAERGSRLPTAGEWMLAAGAAPATGMAMDYPWGAGYAVQRANTVEARQERPVAVGSYSPAGDSPAGASDMAGNVAEWTSTTHDGGATYVVKGGSFRDDAGQALVSAENSAKPDATADWIGFRCAHTGRSGFAHTVRSILRLEQ